MTMAETASLAMPYTPAQMAEVRQLCLKAEAQRERRWRKTPQGEFESAMPSFDALADSFDDPSKVAAFSDGGDGAESVVACCDGAAEASAPLSRGACVKRARERLRRKAPALVEVFNLVLKNGTNRKESIWSMLTSGRRPSGRPQRPATGTR